MEILKRVQPTEALFKIKIFTIGFHNHLINDLPKQIETGRKKLQY